jgi:hypothetical protein
VGGFASGVQHTIAWPLLIIGVLMGLLLGLLAQWFWSQRGQPRVLRIRTA